jgi:hypothetical protein
LKFIFDLEELDDLDCDFEELDDLDGDFEELDDLDGDFEDEDDDLDLDGDFEELDGDFEELDGDFEELEEDDPPCTFLALEAFSISLQSPTLLKDCTSFTSSSLANFSSVDRAYV